MLNYMLEYFMTKCKLYRKEDERNMSNRRAAIRRERKEREKIAKNKSENGKLLQAQSRGIDAGRTISATVVMNALFLELQWSKTKILEFTESLSQQSANGNPDVIAFALQPWIDKFETRIQAHSPVMPKMSITDVIQGIEYQHRNISYVNCCALMFLNLYSNFDLRSNNKGTGKLDKIINQCVIHFHDLLRNPYDYTADKCIERTEKITGIQL